MRRNHPQAVELLRAPALPAPAADVVRVLEPLLTEARLARIERTLDQRTRGVVAVLDGLIDPHNIAAVLRSADAFGTQEVHVIEGSEQFVASQRVIPAMKEKGFVIGGGYGKIKEFTFRIGHMGDHTVAGQEAVLEALTEVLTK